MDEDKPMMEMLTREEMDVFETIALRAKDGMAVLPWTYHTKAGIAVTFSKGE